MDEIRCPVLRVENPEDECNEKKYDPVQNTNTVQSVIDSVENVDTHFLIKKKINQLTIPILESVTQESIKQFKYFNERHYDDRFFNHCNKQLQSEDICIRFHTNKLMLITLAKGNDIVLSGKSITEIDFVVNNGDRSKIKVVGKKKSGAKYFHPESIVCRVKLDGEEQLRNIRCGISGYLVEINEAVKKDPNLLITNPKGNGYLAIMMPKGHLSQYDPKVANIHLVSEEEYSDLILTRKNY